jgi:hypothetical protein
MMTGDGHRADKGIGGVVSKRTAAVQRQCFEIELTRYTGATADDGGKE